MGLYLFFFSLFSKKYILKYKNNNIDVKDIKESSVFATRPATPTSANYNNLITPILASFIPQISLLNAHRYFLFIYFLFIFVCLFLFLIQLLSRCIHMEANQRDDKVLVLQFTNCIASSFLLLIIFQFILLILSLL